MKGSNIDVSLVESVQIELNGMECKHITCKHTSTCHRTFAVTIEYSFYVVHPLFDENIKCTRE